MRCSIVFSVASFIALGTFASCIAEPASREHAQTSSEAGWIRLFDGNSLAGWYTKIQNQKKNEDPAKFFQVENGVIHVYKDQTAGTAVPNGYIATDAEYGYYHLRLEYKWGDKRFKPRAAQRRDAGLLYQVVGPELVWPRSIECQIQEGDVGDCFTVRGTQVVTSIENVDVETPNGTKIKLPGISRSRTAASRKRSATAVFPASSNRARRNATDGTQLK